MTEQLSVSLRNPSQCNKAKKERERERDEMDWKGRNKLVERHIKGLKFYPNLQNNKLACPSL